jgi:hypothetical protein
MRILGSIVAPSTTLISSCDSKITGSGSIRPQIVGESDNEGKAEDNRGGHFQGFAHTVNLPALLIRVEKS